MSYSAMLTVWRKTQGKRAATMVGQVTRPSAPDAHPQSVPAPVLLAGDDGVPLRVREELSGAGVPIVSLCSSAEAVAARGAPSVFVGDWLDASLWDEAGLASAQAVGLLGPDD